jgi:hypothetical protein
MDSTLGGRSHDGDAIKSLNEPKPITQDANSTCAFFWLIRGTGCAAVDGVLLTILMK